ncbi:MAG TPA: hypothetical protein VHZ52_00730 [Acidobacteriaceae bacterium]|jgi:hypothetical protein|nr:hypothetical protein [Acidobacteriaceae bacterium]
MQIWRAFLALLAGFLTMAVLVGVITGVLMRRAPEWVGAQGRPRPGYVAVNLAYSLAAAACGGYVTAWIVRENLLRYSLVLAIVVLLLSALSAVQERGRQPVWYQLTLLAIMPIGVILGGLLRMRITGLI